MTAQNITLDYQEIDGHLDMKIKVLQKELNQLKRVRRARRAKAQSRYLRQQYLSTI